MNISKLIFLTVAAVVVVFAKQTQANISASLAETTELEKAMTKPKYQDDQEAIIMAGTDMDSLAAKAAIEAVRSAVRKFPVHKVLPLAVNASAEGVLEAIRIIYAVVRQANKAIDKAAVLVKARDTEGAIESIQKGFKVERELVFISGIPFHDAQGFALGLVGREALPELKNTIISIQKAGSAIFEALDISNEIAIKGIRDGGNAAEEAFKSARNIISTGAVSTYEHCNVAAMHALHGLEYAATQPIEADVVPGLIDSLKSNISIDDSDALAAIAKLNNGLKSALSVLTKKAAVDAANVIYEGLKSTIKETAYSISLARDLFKEAEKLAIQDVEAAVAAVRKGIKAAQDKTISGSAFGYLALGAAGQIGGKVAAEGLVPSVLEIEYGRVAAYEDLRLAERTALIGIYGGQSATAHGIYTALQICDAAGIALYQDFVDAEEMGFEALQKW